VQNAAKALKHTAIPPCIEARASPTGAPRGRAPDATPPAVGTA